MSKKYRLKKDVLNYSTGHIIPAGEVFSNIEGTRKYISQSLWYMSEAACLLKDWFEEITEPERIEVTDISTAAFSDHGNWYAFHIASNPGKPWPTITKEQFPALKAAIEQVLNSTTHICKHCNAEVSEPDEKCYKAPPTTRAPEQFVIGVDPIRGNFEWKDDAQTQVVFKREEKGEWVAMYRKDKPWSQEQFEADMKKAAEYFSKVPLLCEKCGEIGKHKETCSQYTPPKPQPLFTADEIAEKIKKCLKQ